jgi:hypothetical protein
MIEENSAFPLNAKTVIGEKCSRLGIRKLANMLVVGYELGVTKLTRQDLVKAVAVGYRQ